MEESGEGGEGFRIVQVKKKWHGNETQKTWECGFLPSTSSEHVGTDVRIRNLIPTDVRLLNTS